MRLPRALLKHNGRRIEGPLIVNRRSGIHLMRTISTYRAGQAIHIGGLKGKSPVPALGLPSGLYARENPSLGLRNRQPTPIKHDSFHVFKARQITFVGRIARADKLVMGTVKALGSWSAFSCVKWCVERAVNPDEALESCWVKRAHPPDVWSLH